MANPISSRQLHIRNLAWTAFACLCLSLSLSGVSGCKTVEIDPEGTDSVDTAVTGTAIVRITNNISEDPDSLVFFLFTGNATDFSNASKARRVGGVGVNGTGVFTVPAGTWKLAYENQSRVLTPMSDIDSEEWLKAIFVKGQDYSLILTSDGKNILWNPTFKTDPEIR